MQDIKNHYQAAKIKQVAKNRKFFFLAAMPTYGSYDQRQLTITQRSLGFCIYKIKNTNFRKTLRHSIFKKHANMVYGTLVLVYPENNCTTHRLVELLSDKNKKRGLVVMCFFLNKKLYPISCLRNLNHLNTASNLVMKNLNSIKKAFPRLTSFAN